MKNEFGKWNLHESAVSCYRTIQNIENVVIKKFELETENKTINTKPLIDDLKENGKHVKISLEHLKYMMQLARKTKSDTVVMTVTNDFPILFETESFEMLIAPRVSA